MRSGVLVVLIAFGAAVPATSPAFAQDRCEPAACLAAILAKVSVSVADVPSSDVAGLWKGGEGMLSGENLYLFPDGSYIYTEWGDLLPETIYDKGKWLVEAGVVRFSPDQSVVWDTDGDRRFAVLTLASASERWLVGLDRTLASFLDLVREHPDTTPREWLEVCALKRKGGIAASETEALTKRLHETGWRPGYFRETADVEASQRTLDELLQIVGHADRVEALLVSIADEGIRSAPMVEERPVAVDSRTSAALARLLTGFDWSTASPMACMFTPHVAFRFHRGDRSAQVLVCFECGEMVLDGLDGPLGGRKLLGNTHRRVFLQAARKALHGRFD